MKKLLKHLAHNHLSISLAIIIHGFVVVED